MKFDFLFIEVGMSASCRRRRGFSSIFFLARRIRHVHVLEEDRKRSWKIPA
jgi:hypothetical protein